MHDTVCSGCSCLLVQYHAHGSFDARTKGRVCVCVCVCVPVGATKRPLSPPIHDAWQHAHRPCYTGQACAGDMAGTPSSIAWPTSASHGDICCAQCCTQCSSSAYGSMAQCVSVCVRALTKHLCVYVCATARCNLQSILLVELDGPRPRTVGVQLVGYKQSAPSDAQGDKKQ